MRSELLFLLLLAVVAAMKRGSFFGKDRKEN